MLPPGIATAAVPLPMPWDAVVLPYDVVVPHWKYAVVEAPLGFTVPFNVAPVVVMAVALAVVTVGGVTGHADVRSVMSDPYLVPPVLLPTARKWYVVLHVRPLTVPPGIATAAVPLPMPWDAVVLP